MPDTPKKSQRKRFEEAAKEVGEGKPLDEVLRKIVNTPAKPKPEEKKAPEQ